MLRSPEYTPSHFHSWNPEHLPPFFVRRTWQDKMGLLDTDGRLIDLYHGYWRVERDGKKILPHPRRMDVAEWHSAAQKALIKDAEKWETFEDWAQWWINADRARFYGLGKSEWSNVRKGFKERRLRVRNDQQDNTQ